ncbi:MAG: hypothetical protein KF726_25475 [Anaerolineae bacterium]|nr:hypothetical protein [Anaerolineae bacterium]
MNANVSKLVAGWLFIALLIGGCSGLSSEPSVIATLPPEDSDPHAGLNLTLTPQATLPPVSGSVTGALTVGTAGMTLPGDQELMLHIIDSAMQEKTQLGKADAQGNFRFDNVTIQSDHAYFVTTIFEGRQYASEVVQGNPAAGAIALPLTLYASTNDPAAIQLSNIILQLTASSEGLYAVEIVRVNNAGDRVFTTTEQPQPGMFASVRMAYPSSAQIDGFANGEDRYIVDETEHRVVDTQPVYPQERHVVHFRYQTPYDPAGTLLDVPIDYAIAGDVQILVAPADLTVNVALGDTLLTAGDAIDMGEESYRPYTGTVNAAAGSLLRIALKGAITADQVANVASATTNNGASATSTSGGFPRDLLLGVLFGGGIALIGVGTFLTIRDRNRLLTGQAPAQHLSAALRHSKQQRQQRQEREAQQAKAAKQAQLDPLLAELAELDDLHESSRISEASYRRRRKALKARIATIMGVEVEA